MPRQVAAVIENSFVRGLVDQATAINFPENACTETYNCVFHEAGDVHRRLGFDRETGYSELSVARGSGVVQKYVWRNVAGDGNISFVVLQLGSTLRFYRIGAFSALSSGINASSISLSTFIPSGGPSPATKECQFADGLGYLFVFHPTLEPFYVAYDQSANTFSATQITVEIRDFEGIDDTLADTTRPSTLTTAHKYNLYNQGWDATKLDRWTTGTIRLQGDTHSSTLVDDIKTASAVNSAFTNVENPAGQLLPGMKLTASGWASDPTISSITGPKAVTMSSASSSTLNDTTLVFYFGTSAYPSNADVFWTFKDSTDSFNLANVAGIDRGNTPAPKGHFILTAYNQDRDAASGLSGITDVTSSYFRPSTGAFFAGRVWYAGIQYSGFNSKIYFSQILEGIDQAGRCYQQQDPTSETLFDLLPADGGVINIPEAGTVVKLVSVQNGVLVHTTNGVWFITGSTGIGFTADDYTVVKLDSIPALTHTSFVDVNGLPMWWNLNGVYAIRPGQGGGYAVVSLTETVVHDFYDDIPAGSKSFAKGAYNALTRIVQWIYKSTESADIGVQYEFDRVLNLNTLTGAFYPWTVEGTDVMINDIVVTDAPAGFVSENQVTSNSGADTVQDGSGNNVVVYQATGGLLATPKFKYVVSEPSSGLNYDLTFAETLDQDFVDWASTADNNFESYFITGYKLHGEAQRKFQTNYVWVYMHDGSVSTFDIRGRWDFAKSSATGRWSTNQRISVDPDTSGYAAMRRKVKLRGHGLAVQFEVRSVAGEDFHVLGWSVWETGNPRP